MKNILLIISHLNSGSDELMACLNENERIDLKSNLLTYDNPEMLASLYGLGHKLDNTAAIYGGQILFNKDFCNFAFYKFCKFIYFVRSPKDTLNQFKINNPNYSDLTACRYYCFRLRRIYEMAYQKAGLFCTYDNISSSAIQEYLELPNPVHIKFKEKNIPDTYPADLMQEAEDCYERYFYKIKQLV